MKPAKEIFKNGNDKLRCNEMKNIQVIQWQIGPIKSHYSLSLEMNTPNNTHKEREKTKCLAAAW